MNLRETNLGTFWWFTDEECADFAYLAACMPADRMPKREVDFMHKMEARFRAGFGANLTQAQWTWFEQLVMKYKSTILGQEDAVDEIRAAVAKAAKGEF